MKRVWRKNDKEAVSPVIATILMVAITVVLAAVLYTMVMGGIGDPPENVIGDLYYKSDVSDPANGYAVFDITMTTPDNPKIADLTVKVVMPNQQIVAGAQINWTHLVSDDEHARGGDRLLVTVSGVDISGYEVTISVRDYTGTIKGRVSN
ncbi:MAG: archaellin/type IV pilin N-terminal domain-containing protein [Methanobacteriota archaeon]